MKTRIDPYKLVRLYLKSEGKYLCQDDLDFIDGSIRSRSRRNLANVFRDRSPAYRGTQETRVLAQVSAFFKKNDSFADEVLCTESARVSFLRAEKLCRITNRRLTHFYEFEHRLAPPLRDKVCSMRNYLSKLLGNPSHFLDKIPELVRITSGATESRSRNKALPYLKLGKKLRCTPGAVPFISSLSKYFGDTNVRCTTVQSNRIVVVPKSSDTFRSIACEPVGNVPFQLAFDSYVKDKLTRFTRVNLSDQTPNREAAKEGSITGLLSTIDLSMASDTLALDAVHYLFPKQWCDLLVRLRSSHYKGPFGSGKYAKFSSMGNGMTFALETIVFMAVIHACGSERGLVYGDDIIIESSLYDDVVSLLKYIGFVPNELKSFAEGPFRESCGADFHSGIDVRPVFLKRNLVDRQYLAHFANMLIEKSEMGNEACVHLLALCKDMDVPLVPHGADSTSGLIVPPSIFFAKGHRKKLNWNIYFKGLSSRTKNRRVYDSRTYYLWHFSKMSNLCSDAVETSVVPTDRVKVRLGWTMWFPPHGGVPHHLYWWEECFSRAFTNAT